MSYGMSALSSKGFYELGTNRVGIYNASGKDLLEYGYLNGPGVIDIAAIQYLYGANKNTNSGDNTYVIPDANKPGTAWQSIWDTGGIDEIRYDGMKSSNISLLSYSLSQGITTDGVVNHISQAAHVYGGFIIADDYTNALEDVGGVTGVIIENATGGSGNDRIIGNAGSNVLQGRGGNDILYGLGGTDTMIGGLGNDQYYVDVASDGVVETKGGGTDMVLTSISYILAAGQEIEQLRTDNDAGTAALKLTGNELANRIVGNAGDNTINGALGSDTLFGKGGKDTFVFANTPTASNLDHLGDFSAADDTIQLSKGIFTALSAGTLATGAFKNLGVAGASVDGSDRILYKQSTGELFYDKDGSGSALKVKVAMFDNKAALSAADFFIA